MIFLDTRSLPDINTKLSNNAGPSLADIVLQWCKFPINFAIEQMTKTIDFRGLFCPLCPVGNPDLHLKC